MTTGLYEVLYTHGVAVDDADKVIKKNSNKEKSVPNSD